MTQTLPPPQPAALLSQGPFILAAGVQTNVPYPGSTGVQVVAAVLYNSSPFTLVVSQGQNLGTLAAFTSDVFPLLNGTPIVIQPMAGASLIASGQDAELFVDWLGDWPAHRQYPAALGSGAVNTVGQAQTIFKGDHTPIAAGPGFFKAISPDGTGNTAFPTQGWGGLRVYFQPNTANPLALYIQYFADAAATLPVGERAIFCDGNGSSGTVAPAQFTMPHQGDFFHVVVENPVAGATTCQLMISQTGSNKPEWSGQQQTVFGNLDMPKLISNLGVAIGAGAVGGSTYGAMTYAGPASLTCMGADPGALGDVQLFTMAKNGSYQATGTVPFAAGAQPAAIASLVLPPTRFALAIHNNTAAAHTYLMSVVADEFR